MCMIVKERLALIVEERKLAAEVVEKLREAKVGVRCGESKFQLYCLLTI